MEKDIDRIPKNADTDVIIRIDDFGGRRGVTIREFVRGEKYTGFTKSGTRIPAEHFKAFKQAINSIDEKELMEAAIDPGMQKSLNSSGGMQEAVSEKQKAGSTEQEAGNSGQKAGSGKQEVGSGAGKSEVKHSADKGKAKAKPKVENDIGEEEF